MDISQEFKNLAKVVSIHADGDGRLQDLVQALAHKKPVRGVQQAQPTPHPRNCKTVYLVKLEGPLSSASKIKQVTGLLRLLEQVSGTDDAPGGARFCFITGAEKMALTAALSTRLHRSYTPTFIQINKAEKDLASHGMAPFLGFDPTLPHHRPTDLSKTFLPKQDQYPVWYFFYGTLADPTILATKFRFPFPIVYRSASVTGGELRTWGGKYKALINGAGTVRGWAYQVTCVEREDALRYYETDRYEVVRCAITMDYTGENVLGLTFRFIGEPY
jgi:hypothetical protein